MKGWELLKEIAEGNIKEGTEVREEGSLKKYIYDEDTGDFIDKDNKDWYLLEQYNNLQFATCNFEIIEEQEENTINIQDIKTLEELAKTTLITNTEIMDKTDELIKAIKQLDKEIREKNK